jgi:hypothetical protein
MTRAASLLLVILLSVALCNFVAGAQPSINGSLSGTLGPGDYIVTGNCTVDAGNSLTIQPGTTFLFSGHFSLKVYGYLSAVGTEQDMIYFKRQNPNTTCEWSGIRFMNGCSPNSIVSYAHLEYAKYHTYPDYNGGAFYIEEDGVTITHCWIKDNYASSGGGIYINGATPYISDCVIFGNTAGNGGGMYIYNSNGVVVENCIIAKNSSTST